MLAHVDATTPARCAEQYRLFSSLLSTDTSPVRQPSATLLYTSAIPPSDYGSDAIPPASSSPTATLVDLTSGEGQYQLRSQD